jgi:hypothetical protein
MNSNSTIAEALSLRGVVYIYIHIYNASTQLRTATDYKWPQRKYSPCSVALISTAYQLWYSVFLSQQNSHSRLISRKNSLPTRVMRNCVSSKKLWPQVDLGFKLWPPVLKRAAGRLRSRRIRGVDELGKGRNAKMWPI